MNVAATIAYALTLAIAVGAAAWLLEGACGRVRLPTRWVWLGALPLTVWLSVAAFVAGGRGPDSTGLVANAPIVEIGAFESAGDLAGGGEPARARWDPLASWKTLSGRGIALGVALLPGAVLAPGLVVAAWLATSLSVGLILVLSQLRLRRHAVGWPEVMLRGRPVRIAPRLGPATLGIRRPDIVIPAWAIDLPDAELDLILRHEGEHVRARDTLLLALALVAVTACAWNPVAWWQMRRLRAAVEVDCDRRVLRAGIAAATYADLLVRLGCRGRLASLAVPTISGPPSLLERRLTLMKTAPSNGGLPRALFAASVALLILAAACATEAPVATDPQLAEAAARSDLIAVTVDRDGAVSVNEELHPLGRLSEALASLRSPDAVVSIESHPEAHYRVVAEVQEQLRTAGLLRVAFTMEGSGSPPARTMDRSTLLDQALTVILPDTSLLPGMRQARLPSRNLLMLEVAPSGLVYARRANAATEAIEPSAVEPLWRDLVAANPNLIAIVRTDPAAPYRHMYAVLGALQRAEATRFSLQLAD